MRGMWISLLCFLLASAAAAQPTVLGEWLTEGGNGHVTIYACGDKLCGRLIGLKNSLDEQGQPKRDVRNEKPELRDRPLIGLQLLDGFVADGPRWINGTIYNPEDGNTYKATMELARNGALVVRGYLGIPLLGRSQTWTRTAP